MTRRTLAFLSALVLAAAPSVAMAGGPAKPPKPASGASKPKVVTTKAVTTKVKPVTSVKTTQTKLAKPPKAVKTTTVKTTTVKGTNTKAVKASVKPAKTEKSKALKATKATKATKAAKTTKTTSVEATTSTGATSTTTTTTTTTTSPGDTVALTDVQQKLKRNTNLASKLESRLPAGTDLMKAAYGFKNLGQFVAAVNASYHDGIPFAQLKRKMVQDGMSLGQAKQSLRSSSGTTGGQ